MKLKVYDREPLDDLFIMLKTAKEDSYTAFHREKRLFWKLQECGFFEIPEAKEISNYVAVFLKMEKENEKQLQKIDNILKVINEEMKDDGSKIMEDFNGYFAVSE